jgi:hypothetical protein
MDTNSHLFPEDQAGVELFRPNDAARPLRIFEDARREIAEAETADRVKSILALATGLAAAARKATDREMEAEAEVLKLEAERKLGQLMKAQRETIGLNQGGRPKTGVLVTPVSEKPSLTEAGIDKNLAKKARTAAAMSEKEFKEAISAKRALVRAAKSPTKAAIARNTKAGFAQSKSLIKHVDIIAAWDKASLEERTKAIDGIGLRPLLAALPRDWIPELAKWLANCRQPSAPVMAAAPTVPNDLSIPNSLRRELPHRAAQLMEDPAA